MFSQETLRIFEELLDQVSLQANHPNFIEVASKLHQARIELKAAQEEGT